MRPLCAPRGRPLGPGRLGLALSPPRVHPQTRVPGKPHSALSPLSLVSSVYERFYCFFKNRFYLFYVLVGRGRGENVKQTLP